jgi:hypothetical protein
MAHAITITVSDNLYAQLQRASELTQRPIDTLIAQSIAHSISPLLEDIPPAYQKDVYSLLEMNEEQLQAEAQRVFPEAQWAEYERLLALKKERPLTPAESRQLDALRREADVLMLRKGYAALLLKRRGYQPPTIFMQ